MKIEERRVLMPRLFLMQTCRGLKSFCRKEFIEC